MSALKEIIEHLKLDINKYSTETIAFRQFTRSDSFPLFVATQNPKFNENLAWSQPKNIEEVVIQSDLLLREMRTNTSVVISIVEKNTGTWIGLTKLSIYKDSLIYTTWFHPNSWMKPSVIFSTSAMLDIFFKSTELKKIYVKHAIGFKIMEKLILSNGSTYLYDEPVPHSNGSQVICKTYQLEYENWKKHSKTPIILYW